MTVDMYTDFLKKVLRDSSEIAINSIGNKFSTTKSGDNNQVLTETDLEIGRLIISEIKKEYASYNIIDEEAGVIDNNSEYTWVVDPIDGTSNFANSLPMYGIMIGLLQGDKPIAGGISLPYFKEMYISEKGTGAFCNDIRIEVSNESDLLKSLVAYQIDGHQENPDLTRSETKLLSEILLNIRNLRTSNSAFDACMAANGKYGVVLNKTSKIWDNVAQQIIIEESGGIYTDFYGNEMDYSNPITKAKDNFTYCAGSKILHSQLIDIIKKYE
jgi:myo-inositol-1(or 4)-monophosphatase